MRVLLVNSLYPPHVVGGAEKSCKLLVDALRSRGLTVDVASLHPEKEPKREEQVGGTNYRIPVDLPYWPFNVKERPGFLRRAVLHVQDSYNRKAAGRISGVINQGNYDLIHTNNLTGFSVSVWSASAAAKVPVVHTLRDYSLLCRRATMFRGDHPCKGWCMSCRSLTVGSRWLSDVPVHVVANSRYVLDAHTERGYFPGKATDVIFNIADMSQGTQDATGPAARRSGPVTIGYIGKIAADKGIEQTLEATRAIRATDWKLMVAGVGEPSYVEALQARYSDPRIVWLGFVQPTDFYPEVDCVVVSSVWAEPLPRAMIEAATYGRPIIASRSGGNPELFPYVRLAGSYDATNTGQLADHINAVVDGTAAICDPTKSIRDVLGEDHVSARYISVYESAVRRQSRRRVVDRGDRS